MKTSLLLIILGLLSFSSIASAQDCEIQIELDDYIARDTRPFIRLEDNQLMAGDEAYLIYGINYYPRDYPWRRFLTEANSDTLHVELEMMRDTGFNTLRIFLWNQALFQCDGRSTAPVEPAFSRLDRFMALAHNYDFRLIVTLNDLPNLDTLYTNPPELKEQTHFIVNRYRDEPSILAWDLRNEGDIDYGSRGILETRVPRIQVLQWLKDTSAWVHSIDSNHLLTAGWLNEAHSTAPYVDFISFHHWTSVDELERRIRALRLTTSKPILLEEVGYSTLHANITPQVQADLLETMIRTSEDQGLLGWMIWTAFDFHVTATCYPSPCQSPNNAEHYYGIWNVDYVPKPAVEIIRQYTEHKD